MKHMILASISSVLLLASMNAYAASQASCDEKTNQESVKRSAKEKQVTKKPSVSDERPFFLPTRGNM